MPLDKYSELKIAGNVLGFTMQEFASDLDTYPQVVKDVAEGKTTSARISKAIDETIERAEEVYREHRERKLAAQNQ